jgi:hypothetical protein
VLRALEAFEEDEQLYRLIDHSDVDGDRVHEGAIDTNGGARGTSFFRSKHCKRADLPVTDAKPMVARMSPHSMPEPIEDVNGVLWSFFPADDPEDHIAHAEVRYRKGNSEDPRGDRPKSPATKLAIRVALAEKLRVC